MAIEILQASKVCGQCNVRKPASEFFKRTSGGRRYLRYNCKDCCKANRPSKALVFYGPDLDAGRKMCVACLTTYPIENFPMTKDGRHARCIGCRNQYNREYWHKIKVVATPLKIQNKRLRNIRNIEFLIDHFKDNPCMDCGETDPIVLEFDHRDPSMKRDNISELSQDCSLNVLKAEVDKCDVVCANCHRRRTAKQYKFLICEVLQLGGSQ